MPTIFTHAAVPLALGGGLGRGIVSGRLLAAGVVVSVLPDLDVVTLQWGIPYSAGLGHRGFSHSLLMAALVALIGAAAHRTLRSGFAGAFAFLFASMASHGALDAFTDGGLGVAFLWPWSPADSSRRPPGGWSRARPSGSPRSCRRRAACSPQRHAGSGCPRSVSGSRWPRPGAR